jgi:hypothetical protein
VRADARAQELRSDLRRGLSRLAGPLPEEVLSALNANKEEQAFQSALIHLQAVRAMCASHPSQHQCIDAIGWKGLCVRCSTKCSAYLLMVEALTICTCVLLRLRAAICVAVGAFTQLMLNIMVHR